MPPEIDEKDLTPLMRQYLAIKRKHGDSLLFYRMGDFYEMFWEDAEVAARELNITLTARDKGPYGGKIPLAGIPHHALDNYLPRLVKKGYKVAIAEQVEDPKKAKGIVKRDVIRVVTPGTMVSAGDGAEEGNNYLTAVMRMVKNGASPDLPMAQEKGSSQERICLPSASYGLAHLDVSTGEFHATEISDENPFQRLISELMNISPAEIIIPKSLSEKKDFMDEMRVRIGTGIPITAFPDHFFLENYASDLLKEQFGVISLEGYGLDGNPLALGSAGAVLAYARENQMCDLGHIKGISHYSGSDFMVLDSTSLRNLEVTRSLSTADKKGTLLSILDSTRTSMGSRLLRNWIQRPLVNRDAINNRLNCVQALNGDLFLRSDIREHLRSVSDLERLIARFTLGRANARDLQGIMLTLRSSKGLRERLSEVEGLKELTLMSSVIDGIRPEDDLVDEIASAVVDEPPASIREGGMIRKGYSDELDEIRNASGDSKAWLKNFESGERKRTGIKSLKVKFNNVFGYYIEVTKANLDQVPEDYIRKQTLVGSERFITPELKEKETLILNARERMCTLEEEIFERLSDEVISRTGSLQETARNLARLDVLNTLADVAARKNYVRPEIDDSRTIRIKGGRHPVIEERVEWGFVPNDAFMDGDKNRFIILTGPNMAGKSTYMRQVALTIIMAQMGSFVPAGSASVGLVDRIFTRVGASDDLVKGQSTFMVEMLELANILNSATNRSFIILDEIGRGTSTFDGLAIAWAVTEYISDSARMGANTVFATHYHHLTELEGTLEGTVNYHMAVKEGKGGITFLRKVRKGSASRSYGVEVADLAGIPKEVVERAREVLGLLEKADHLEGKASMISTGEDFTGTETPKRRNVQMVLFPTDEMTDAPEDPIIREIRRLDPANMTPLQALETLYRIRRRLDNP